MATNLDSDNREGLTAESWWAVDISQEPRLTVGATPLVRRCMRTHGWTLEFALRVLEGYKTFLTIKQTFADWDATRYAPPIPVDRMWREHLVDNKNYAKDCELLFGRVMYHDPDESLDAGTHDDHIGNTKTTLIAHFGDDYDREVWNFGVMLIESEEEERSRRMTENRAASRAREASVPSPDDALTIRIRDQVGEETFFKIRRSTVMQKVFEAYAERKQVRRRSLRFVVSGQTVTDDDTAISLELVHQDAIDVISRNGVAHRPSYNGA